MNQYQPYQDPFSQIFQSIKSLYSTVGAGLFIAVIAELTVSSLLGVAIAVVGMLRPGTVFPTWITLVVGTAGVYLAGVPAAWAVMKRLPRDQRPAEGMGFGRIAALFLACIPIMYGGNILGTFLSRIFSAGKASNPLDSLLDTDIAVTVAIACVAAPIFEELLFRKILIDRLSGYSEKFAVLFSALCFAMFHMNFFQFFYTFGMGLIFAYVYVKTKKVAVTVTMHALLNLWGSLPGILISKYVDLDALNDIDPENISSDQILPLILTGLYGISMILLILAGIAFIVIEVRKLSFRDAPPLPAPMMRKAVFANAGFIAFAVACGVMTVASLFT